MSDTEIEPGLHRIEHLTKDGWSLVTHVLPLARGTLVHSPVRQLVPRILALGRPEFVLAPNHYHHLGIAPLVARAPGCTLVAADVAIPRLTKQTRLSFQKLSVLEPHLPPGVRVRVLDGAANGEVLLTVPVGERNVWVVCDALFHQDRPVGGLQGFVLRATGTIPGLRVGATFRFLAGDRAKVGKALREALAEDQPVRLHFSHGEPYTVGDGAELRKLIETRLG